MIYYIFYFTFICTPGCLACLICLVTWLIQTFALRNLLYGNYLTIWFYQSILIYGFTRTRKLRVFLFVFGKHVEQK